MADRQAKITMLGNILGHQFNDQDVAWKSLQAPGAKNSMLYPEGNKRMAMPGDSIVQLVILEDTLAVGLSRGAMNATIQRVANNGNLDHIGRANGLQHCINKNPAQGNVVSQGVMSATVEAVLYAVYEDTGSTTGTVRIVMNTLGLWPEQ